MADKPTALPPVAQETRLRLEALIDPAKFQLLCDALLSGEYGYDIRPRGVSARGTVRGQPDSWGYDVKGRLCAFAYGINADWQSKIGDDLDATRKLAADGFAPAVFVFCTNRHVDAAVERRLQQQVRTAYGWELQIIGQGEISVALDTRWQDLRKRFLGVRIERHNWSSLIEACRAQRSAALPRYQGKYDPSLYVQRDVERVVELWYRQSVDSIAQSKTPQQLLCLVDQAGAGKSNLLLHLAN